MSCSALVLAAHGFRGNGADNAQVRACAAAIAADGLFDEVAVAFHCGEPTFATVLDNLEADDITVVPFFGGNGYFCDTVLPRELAVNARFDQVRLRLTQPIGTHPEIIRISLARIADVLASFGLAERDTALIVVGHGTRRHAKSRLATRTFAAAVGSRLAFRRVEAAFLDDDPGVREVCSKTDTRNVLAVPFLIGGGQHATIDIPIHLGLDQQAERGRLVHGHVDGRLIVCDIAVGEYPEMIDVCRDLVRPFARSARVGCCQEVARR